MNKKRKHGFVIGFGILFVLSGSYLAYEKGIPLLLEADRLVTTLECNTGLACTGKDMHHPIMEDGVVISQLSGGFSFISPHNYVVYDKIKFVFDLKPTNSEVIEKMAFLIMPSDTDFSNDRNLPYEELKKKYQNKGFIELTKLDNGRFFNDIEDGFWSYSNIVEVKVAPIVLTKNQTHFLQESDNVFKVEDPSTKIKLVDQHEEKIGNKTILALTWIGIAIAPILLGIDIVVRVVLREN